MTLDQITDTVIADVDQTISRFAAFEFSLTQLCRWPDVTYLAPSPAEPFIAMTQAIAAQFPAFPPYAGRHQDIVPHLTVASGNAASAATAENELAFSFNLAGAIQSTCRAVEWIENSSGMWKVFRVVNLQNSGA
jgi:2'-5' RNA ligase